MAAGLSKRGYAVAVTMGNAEAIDLFAEKGRWTLNIQVKATRVRRNVGWPILRAKVMSNGIDVFVCLNEMDSPPTYFVATPTEVRPRVKEYGIRGILNLGELDTPQFRERWDKVELGLRARL